MDRKRRVARYFIWLIIFVITAIALIRAERNGWQGAGPSGNSSSHPLSTINPKMRSLFAQAAAQHLALGARTATAACAARGALPDPACTPGAIFPQAMTSTICVSGYTTRARHVTDSTKKKVYQEYGFTYPQRPTGSFEADHLIPLELGGSNDIANLWPEAANPVPGFHEKDMVENYLNDEVCHGNLDLKEAQILDAVDWLAIYNSLTPAEIAALKSRWAEN